MEILHLKKLIRYCLYSKGLIAVTDKVDSIRLKSLNLIRPVLKMKVPFEIPFQSIN